MKCALYPLCAPMITTPRKLTIALTNWNLPPEKYSELLLINSCTGTTAALSTRWASIPPSQCSQPGPIFQFSLRFLSSHSIIALTPGEKMLAEFPGFKKSKLSSRFSEWCPREERRQPPPSRGVPHPSIPNRAEGTHPVLSKCPSNLLDPKTLARPYIK